MPRNKVSKKWSSIRFRYRANDELRTKRNVSADWICNMRANGVFGLNHPSEWGAATFFGFCVCNNTYRDGEKGGPQVPWMWMRNTIARNCSSKLNNKGGPKRWTRVSVSTRWKIAYYCLQQAGDRNFSSSFSQNLGSTFQAIPAALSLP